MPTIKFIVKGTSNPSVIYIRFVDGRKTDIITKTNLAINHDDWSNIKQKPKNLKYEAYKNLDFELQKIKVNLLNHYNNANSTTVINLQWLKDFINPPKTDIPNLLVPYFDYYLQDRGQELNHRTVLKIKVVQNKLINFEKTKRKKYLISEVGTNFKKDFEKYNLENKYAPNTILGNLKEIKSICLHARKKGIMINSEIEDIKTSQKKAESIYLTFDELKKIEDLKLKVDEWNNARDWLIISCYTGQRISDFMRFDSAMIRTQDNIKLIDFVQKKTGKIMTLPLHEKILNILKKRSNHFPKPILEQKYNELIRSVCRKAKIDETVYGGKMIKKRKVLGSYPKYELVSSHIGRRSFASNFYGKIPTSLLISATGHSTEKMFLIYIGKSSSDQAMQLSQWF